MKIDVNILKEDPKEFEEYQKIMQEDEKNGNFLHDQDVVDPNSYLPVDENFPYIRKGLICAIKRAIYGKIIDAYAKQVNRKLTNLKIEGQENLKGIKGAIITCNHISKVDSFAVREASKSNIMFVTAEHNNWKGEMGKLARGTGLIPLPTTPSVATMRKFTEAIRYYAKKGRKILIYPEQAMWREYKKPRPLQNGAFHYATMCNVPILPMFITIQDKPQKIDENGRVNFGDYTIHILQPIYPNPNLSQKENEKFLKEQNAKAWQEVYKKVYKV